jgi:hypothetical protein
MELLYLYTRTIRTNISLNHQLAFLYSVIQTKIEADDFGSEKVFNLQCKKLVSLLRAQAPSLGFYQPPSSRFHS